MSESRGLTPKQEKFLRAYIEKSNAAAAYRMAYDVKVMSDNAVYVEANKMLKHPKIALFLSYERQKIAQRHEVTTDTLTAEFEEARQLAFEVKNPSAAVSASTAKAKLHGKMQEKVAVTVKRETTPEERAIMLQNLLLRTSFPTEQQ